MLLKSKHNLLTFERLWLSSITLISNTFFNIMYKKKNLETTGYFVFSWNASPWLLIHSWISCIYFVKEKRMWKTARVDFNFISLTTMKSKLCICIEPYASKDRSQKLGVLPPVNKAFSISFECEKKLFFLHLCKISKEIWNWG